MAILIFQHAADLDAVGIGIEDGADPVDLAFARMFGLGREVDLDRSWPTFICGRSRSYTSPHTQIVLVSAMVKRLSVGSAISPPVTPFSAITPVRGLVIT